MGSSAPNEDNEEVLDSLPVVGLLTPSSRDVSFEEFSLVADGSTTIVLVFDTPGSITGLSGFFRIGRAWPITVKSSVD